MRADVDRRITLAVTGGGRGDDHGHPLARLLVLLLASPVAGAATWTPIGPEGGLVFTVVPDPSTPGMLYAGTYDGGVFVSTDGGASWSATGYGPTNVYAVAVDPTTPSTVFAGGYDRIWRSRDAGAHWTLVLIHLLGTVVRDVAVDPVAPNVVYAAVDGLGVRRSTDGGDTWTASNAGLDELDAYAVLVDPTVHDSVYLATEDGVFRSTDGGTTWSARSAGLVDLHVRMLVIDPTDHLVLLAGTAGGLFRTADGGATWTAWGGAALAGLDVQRLATSTSGAAVYAQAFADSPQPGSRGDLERMRSHSEPESGLGVRRSGGRTDHLRRGRRRHPQERRPGRELDGREPRIRSIIATALVADPLGTLYALQYAAIYATRDEGATWAPTPLSGATFYQLVQEPRRLGLVVAGESDAGSPVRVSRDKVRWRAARGLGPNRVGSLVVDPTRRGAVYAGTYDAGIWRSRNRGARWRLLPQSPLDVDVTGLATAAWAPSPCSPRPETASTGPPTAASRGCDRPPERCWRTIRSARSPPIRPRPASYTSAAASIFASGGARTAPRRGPSGATACRREQATRFPP